MKVVTKEDPSMIPLYDPVRVHKKIEGEIEDALIHVIRSGRYILGPEVEKFEKNSASYLQVKEAVGVGSGSDAIYLALKALGIGEGDEVITTPFTFFATVEAILHVGATPIFADIDPLTFNIDPKEVKKKLSKFTRAILPVHLFGHPADMSSLIKIAEDNQLYIIEDACQAFGAHFIYNDQKKMVGSQGTAGAFSFFPTKNLGGVGDGGLVTTNDPSVSEKIRMLRNHGAKRKYHNLTVGINSRLDAIQAAVLNVKIKYVDIWNNERRKIAKYYDEKIISKKVKKPIERDGFRHVYHQYTLRVRHRGELRGFLAEKHISSAVYYPYPLHLLPALNFLGYKEGDFPKAEKASKEVLSIPMFPGLTQEELERIVDAINAF